jgi:hypothetical protein
MSDSQQKHYTVFRNRLHLLAAVFAVIFMVCSVRPAEAQLVFGQIVGNVTDPSGGAVPAATVKITWNETNETREAKTTDTGSYTLSTVHTGTYTVAVTKEGFKTYTAQNVLVSAGSEVRVDASLQVGAQTQTIEVTAQSAELQTDHVEVHSEFTSTQLADLPQPSRMFENLVTLAPGIVPVGLSGGGNNNPSKSVSVEANGTSNYGTAVLIDGVEATNPWVQSNATYAPSTEAIEMVNVVTGSSSSDTGLTQGASIQVQTKSGSNTLHGEVYEYFVTDKFEARPFFLAANQQIPKLVESDYGATSGGRIIKNKLFWFGSYERDIIKQGADSLTTIPTQAMITGNMSGDLALGTTGQLYNPYSSSYTAAGIPTSARAPFAGDIIPPSLLSPPSLKLVALLPQPNEISASATTPSNNYYINVPSSNSLQHIDTKFDWVATSKWKLTGRYGFMPYLITQPSDFGPIVQGGPNTYQGGHTTAVAIASTYILSPTTVIDTNWGYTFAHMILDPQTQNLGSQYLGIPGVNLGTLPHSGGMPQFSIPNFTGYGYNYSPLQYDDPVFQYIANVTKIKGRHNMKFGTNISQQHMNHFEVAPTSISFNGDATVCSTACASTLNTAANAYNDYSDFMLGLPQSFTNSLEPDPHITLRTWEYSLYFQDQWNISKRLSLTLGSRWEYYPVPGRAPSAAQPSNGIEAYNFTTNTFELCGIAPNNDSCGITVQKDEFAPRIGVAYRPTERLVIRAGYSLSPEQQNMFRDGIYTYPVRLDLSESGNSVYDPITNLVTGFPIQPAPTIVNGGVPMPFGASFGQAALLPENKEFIRGYTESDNFTVQDNFGKGWIGSVAYVGSLTIHQHTRLNVNYSPTLGCGTTCEPFYPLGVSGQVIQIEDYETMHYNSLQATLNHRFSHGFLWSTNYTRSKQIGTCCDEDGDATGGPTVQVPSYMYLNRSLEPSDRPNNFNTSVVYTLPFGKGQQFLTGRIPSLLLGGWQTNYVFTHFSGSPLSASGGGALNTTGLTQRANQVLPTVQYFGNEGPGQYYFNPAAFAAAPAGVLGNEGYETLRGPGQTDLDVSLFRSFKIKERFTAQFRAECYNISNTPAFSSPQGSVTSSTFGEITGVGSGNRQVNGRYIRFGLKIKW